MSKFYFFTILNSTLLLIACEKEETAFPLVPKDAIISTQSKSNMEQVIKNEISSQTQYSFETVTTQNVEDRQTPKNDFGSR